MIQKFLLSAILLALFPVFTRAQFFLGASAGPNFSFWHSSYTFPIRGMGYKPQVGWRVAEHSRYVFSPLLALRVDAAFQVLCNRFDGFSEDISYPGPGFEPDPETAFSTIEQYSTLNGSLVVEIFPLRNIRGFYLLSGHAVSYFINGWNQTKMAANGWANQARQPLDLDMEARLRTRWSGSLGLGYGIRFGCQSRIAVEFSYQYELHSFKKMQSSETRVQSASLTLGYFYQL